MTLEDFNQWLKVGGKYTVLVEVSTSPALYLSTVPYVTLPTDTDPNRMYSACIAGGVAITENLPLDGTASLSTGDIEIHNEDATLDSWLDMTWVNREIKVFIGDVTWSRGDFKMIFSGLVSELTSSSANRLNIVLRDKLQRLNTPVTEDVIGGDGSNKDDIVPLLFGECHNITPVLVDAPNETYKIHNAAIERIIEVRDNGVPIVTTDTLSNGTFKLTAQPAGAITVSAQGSTPYTNTVAGIIQRLVTQYGNAFERLTSADLDTAQINSFDIAHQQPVGIYLTGKTNVLGVCQELAASVGAQVSMSKEGKLRLLKVIEPSGSPVVTITPADYVLGSLQISERTTVLSGMRLGYCKNWTTQDNLETGIPTEHKDLFAKEWLTVSSNDAVVATEYRLHGEPEQEDTLLLNSATAQAESDRRLNLWKKQRTVYRLTGYSHLLTLELGSVVELKVPRFGLNNGKLGQIISIQSDWIGRRVTLEVLV